MACSTKGDVHPLASSEGVKRLKMRLLVSLIDSLGMDQCIIFCRYMYKLAWGAVIDAGSRV